MEGMAELRGSALKQQLSKPSATFQVGSYLHNILHGRLHNTLYWPLFRRAFGPEETWENKSLLIAFCGTGREAMLLRPYVKELVAFDGNPNCAALVQSLFQEDPYVKVFENDGFSLKELPDNCVDMATALVALMHICSASVRKNYMAEFFRVLKPGGIVFFQEGGWRGWDDFEGAEGYGMDGCGFPDVKTLRTYTESFGFSIQMLEETPNPIVQDVGGVNPWWWVAAQKL
jgi:SAM-dependent methyltransferase